MLSVVFTPANITNYSAVTNTVNVGVLPAPLTITANNQSKIYGAKGRPDGQLRWLCEWEHPNQPCDSAHFAHIGSSSSQLRAIPHRQRRCQSELYHLVCQSFADNNRRSWSLPQTTKRSRTPHRPLTARHAGFVNGDVFAICQPLSLTTSGKSNSPVGSYPIVASAARDSNYAITYINGVLTVTGDHPASLQ